MVKAKVYGFSEQERGPVLGALRESGWEAQCDVPGHQGTEELEDLGCAAGPPCLIVAAIREASDAATLARCVHRAPQHLYVAGLQGTVDCSLISSVALDLRGGIFFLPPAGAELLRLFHDCRTMVRALETRATVALGTRRLEIDLEIESAALHVTEVAWYLTERLTDAGFGASFDVRQRTELALEEALLNAVEHGNLELDSRLRSGDAGGVDPYESLRRERLADPRYGRRKVRVELRIGSRGGALSIADEGSGIPPGAAPDVRASDGAGVGGRGMALIRRAFDAVECRGSTMVMKLGKERGDGARYPPTG